MHFRVFGLHIAKIVAFYPITLSEVAKNMTSPLTPELEQRFVNSAKLGLINDVHLLLSMYGDSIINAQPNGYTALMEAVMSGKNDIVDLLISKEANLNEKNSRGITALMFAVLENQVDSYFALIGNGADATIEDNNGRTALTLARITNKPNMESLLLSLQSVRQQDHEKKVTTEVQEMTTSGISQPIRTAHRLILHKPA